MANLVPIPRPDHLGDAAANAWDIVFRGGVADLRPTPARIIDEGPKRPLSPSLPPAAALPARALRVLLAPPLAAPSRCFDLRRGCSLAEHMLSLGHSAYLLEYGHIG